VAKTIARPMKNKEIALSMTEGTILYLRQHPTMAAKYLLNVKLNWIQRLALRAIWFIPFVMLVLGRRNGKTYIGAVASVLIALLFPNERVLIVAPSKRQVDWVFLNEINNLYINSDYFKASVVGKISITNAYNRVKLTNGSTIEGYPVGSEGNKVRGSGASFLWVDEYASMSESVINLVFRPMLAVKKKGQFNRYLITSSAYYRWNHLWNLFQYYKIKSFIDSTKYCVLNFNYEHLLLSDNLPIEFDMNIIEEARNNMTETEFKMEMMGIFPVDIEGFFTSQLIDKSTPKPPDFKPIEIELKGDGTSDYYMGVDVGRAEGGSNFSISIVKRKSKKGSLVNLITANGATFQDMTEMVRRKFLDFNVKRIKMDAGGGGTTLKDLLREPWSDAYTHKSYKPLVTLDDTISGIPVLSMVKFTDEVHNNLYMNVKSEMEHGRLLFPLDLRRDENKELERIGQEIVAFKNELRVTTASPKGRYLRFEVPNRFRNDRIISTALAVEAYLESSRNEYSDEEILATGFWI